MSSKSPYLNIPRDPKTGSYRVSTNEPSVPDLPKYEISYDYWRNPKFRNGTTEVRKELLKNIEQIRGKYIGNKDYLDDPEFIAIAEEGNIIKQKAFVEKWNTTHPDIKRQNEKQQREIDVNELLKQQSEERKKRAPIVHAEMLREIQREEREREEREREEREEREREERERRSESERRSERERPSIETQRRMTDLMKENYRILGIKLNATSKEIKNAFRKEQIKYHPDKNRGNEEESAKQFIKVNDAYDYIINEIRGGRKSNKRKTRRKTNKRKTRRNKRKTIRKH